MHFNPAVKVSWLAAYMTAVQLPAYCAEYALQCSQVGCGSCFQVVFKLLASKQLPFVTL
jgi:hypothetical protein